jgi:hypothetical protein
MVECVDLAMGMVDRGSYACAPVFEHENKLNVWAFKEGIGSLCPQIDYCTNCILPEQTQLTVVVRAVQNHFTVFVAKCRPTILEGQS